MLSMLSTLAWCDVQLRSHLCMPGICVSQRCSYVHETVRDHILFWFCSLRPLWLLVIVSAFVAVSAMAS